MYKKLIAIDCSGLRFGDIQKFITNYSRMVFSGQGSKGNFVRDLNLIESDALRVFLGFPDEYITPERQKVLETTYAYSYGLKFGAHPEIWVDKTNWGFTNSNASLESDLDGVALDFEYIKSFGFRNAVWENEILHAKIQSYKDRIENGQSITEQNFKLMMALAIFGFPDPYQFFTDIGNVK